MSFAKRFAMSLLSALMVDLLDVNAADQTVVGR